MISILETGYFIWNFTAWIKIFLLSASFLFIDICDQRKRAEAISAAKDARVREDRDGGHSTEDGNAENQ